MAKATGMKIVSMERTDAEKKAAEERYKAMPAGNGPDFPWGLSLNLGADEMAKLGVKDLPKAGTEFQLVAVAVVTRSSSTEVLGDKGEDSRSIELQITGMALAAGGGDEVSAAEKLYGKGDEK